VRLETLWIGSESKGAIADPWGSERDERDPLAASPVPFANIADPPPKRSDRAPWSDSRERFAARRLPRRELSRCRPAAILRLAVAQGARRKRRNALIRY